MTPREENSKSRTQSNISSSVSPCPEKKAISFALFKKRDVLVLKPECTQGTQWVLGPMGPRNTINNKFIVL